MDIFSKSFIYTFYFFFIQGHLKRVEPFFDDFLHQLHLKEMTCKESNLVEISSVVCCVASQSKTLMKW